MGDGRMGHVRDGAQGALLSPYAGGAKAVEGGTVGLRSHDTGDSGRVAHRIKLWNRSTAMGELMRRIRYLLNRRRFDAELENDMEFHREMAAREGRRNFGNTLRLREQAHEAW